MRIHGDSERAFSPLIEAFERIVEDAPGGAALAVYHRGRKVVDVWAGKRDAEGRPWERDTATVVFSTTKGVASTVLHQLVDRGLLSYDDPVAKHWPGFAQRGKGDITVRDVLTHRAGLSDTRRLLGDARELLDWEGMLRRLEEAEPGDRGPRSSYHALTYGHLVGGIAEKVTGTPFPRLVRTMIAEPLDLEGFHIGAPESATQHAARLIFGRGGSSGGSKKKRKPLRLRFRAPFLEPFRDALFPRGIHRFDMSSPEALAACIPAANGLFTARDLARMYAALAEGGSLDGTRILSREALDRVRRPVVSGPDRVLLVPMGWRLGYHRVGTLSRRTAPGAIGHYGFGGSGAFADPERRLAVAFVVNYGFGTPVGDLRVWYLNGVALGCADRLEARERRTA